MLHALITFPLFPLPIFLLLPPSLCLSIHPFAPSRARFFLRERASNVHPPLLFFFRVCPSCPGRRFIGGGVTVVKGFPKMYDKLQVANCLRGH